MSTFNGGPNLVTSGLVLYLDAANPRSYVSGSTTWSDLTISGNNGTLINGPTFSSANGGSIVFDGTDDYVGGSLPTFNVGCISMWILPSTTVNASSSGQAILTLRWTGVTNSEWYIALGSVTTQLTNEYITVLDVVTGRRTGITNGGSLLANVWHNLTFNIESGTYKIYINGIRVNETVGGPGGVTQLTSPNILAIGALSRGTLLSLPFSGRISTIQLYNRALSAFEILQNYEATKSRFGL